MNADDLRASLHDLTPRSGEIDATTVDPVVIARAGRRRRRGRWGVVGAAAAVIAAGIVVPVTQFSGTASGVETANSAPGIPTADELTINGMPARACGGIAPLAVLTAKGGAENADTPEAAGLRNVIAHDPTGGESPQHGGNWVLLAEQDGKVTFGQRTGAVGIGATVRLAERNGVYSFYQSGGCGAVGYTDGSTADFLGSYQQSGDTLTINYTGSIDPIGPCNPGPPVVHVFEHASTVDLLPLLPPPEMATASAPLCSLVGRLDTVTVHLDEALGDRVVRNIGYVPPRLLQLCLPPKGRSCVG